VVSSDSRSAFDATFEMIQIFFSNRHVVADFRCNFSFLDSLLEVTVTFFIGNEFSKISFIVNLVLFSFLFN
jgi:hypothetical protein